MKWYCNYCKRQCSDENGYKVHSSTFAHQAAVERYNRDPSGNRTAASNDFLSGFCAVLQGFSARQKLKKGTVGSDDDWVDSNLVYQEYIKDRHHVHLSGTRWKSVAGFVRFLGQKGVAVVKKKKKIDSASQDYEDKYIFGGDSIDESEGEDEEIEEESEGEEVFEKDPTKRPKWFIKLIDKSPEAILAAKSKAAASKKSSEEESLQSRQMASVERKAAVAAAAVTSTTVPVIISLQQSNQYKPAKVASIFEESSFSDDETGPATKIQKKNSVLEEIAAEEIKFKKERRIPDNSKPISYFPSAPIEISVDEDEEEDEIAWIRKGLLIKIGNESIGNGKYFGLLAVIDEVIDEFGAQVTVLKNGDQLLLDQDDCLPVSQVKDEEFDQQLSTIDQKIMSTALKTDRCILLRPFGFKGKEGRIVGFVNSNEFKVEVSAAGSSQIHRKQFNLSEGQFCIYWE